MKKLNKNLEMNKDFKENIISAENGRYIYYDYDLQTIKDIAKVDPQNELTYNNVATLVQVLFPEYLVCSGLFDNFIMFKVKNGRREDSPKYCYRSLDSYLNNNNDKKDNLLIEEIVDLFKQNNIDYNKIWDEALERIKGETK